MISLLLALAGAPAAQGETATLQSCEMTPSGWVCQYRIPAVTVIETVEGAPTIRPLIPPAPPPATTPAPAPDRSAVETSRQARLIARCADATWKSLCLPGDRAEARRLRAATQARQTLRAEVTKLLSEGKCPEAVKAALAGADLDLAREARSFCTP